MMGDWFWDIATSAIVLSAIAIVLIAAFIIAHVPAIVQRFWPTVAAYSKAAALVQVIAAALLFFLIGFRISDERAETKQLKNDLGFKERQLKTAKATAEDAERLKAEAERQANEAKGELDEFRKNFGDGKAGCDWTVDEFGQLRNLGRAKRR